MTARTAADLLTGRELGAAYRSMSRDVDRAAMGTRIRGLKLEAGIQRNWARIAKRAALGEELQPDIPDDVACTICGRYRSCLAVSR